MGRAAAVLLAALALGSCGGDDPASEEPPVLTVGSTCYGACTYAGPEDVPEVAVYGDGTVVALEREGDGYVQRTTTLADDQLRALLDRAEEAGLFAGGVDVNGTTQGTADGGGTLFTGRDGDDVTVVEAPFLGYAGEPPASADPEQRRQLEALADELRALGEDGETVDVERYADVDEARERCEVVDDVTPRPLLPHERDCDDVARSLAELRLKDLQALRS